LRQTVEVSERSRLLRTSSRAETVEIGRSLARLLVAGDIVILRGELGAGKTALTTGIIAGLGNTDQVTSPTFTIMRHHDLPAGQSGAARQVLHLDAYRLASADDAEDIGLLELLDNGAIAIIEWGERLLAALGPEYLDIELAHVDEDDDVRTMKIQGFGDRWNAADLAVISC
jgi:tRNA threonylcarbamoyladenosine biosynthesis protein TsaE